MRRCAFFDVPITSPISVAELQAAVQPGKAPGKAPGGRLFADASGCYQMLSDMTLTAWHDECPSFGALNVSVPSGSQLSTSLATLTVTAMDGSFGKFWESSFDEVCLNNASFVQCCCKFLHLPVSRRGALSLALVHLQVLPTFLGRTASLKAF